MSSAFHLSRAQLTPFAARPQFTVRVLSRSDAALLAAAQRLRAEVFVRELGWTPGCACGREHDRCDTVATHVVALASASPHGSERDDHGARWRVAGYARILLPAQTFMLEREFAALLPDGPVALEPTHSFEISRFVVHPDLRGAIDDEGRSAAEHLQRGIARWALEHQREQLYSVCETRHVRALRLRALPVQRFGRVVEYSPGVRTCAIHLDLCAARQTLLSRRPRDARWYTQGVAQC